MGLQPDAVDLALQQHRRAGGHRRGDVRGAAGEHRPERSSDLQGDCLEGALSAGQSRLGDRSSEAREHDGALHRGQRDLGGLGDRGEHDAVLGALADATEHQAAQVLLLGRRCAAQQFG